MGGAGSRLLEGEGQSAHPQSLSLSSFLPKANELPMAVETGALDQPSISLCFSLPPTFPPPTCRPLLLFLLPGFLAEPEAPWLRFTFFIVCQQILGDGAGGLVRK